MKIIQILKEIQIILFRDSLLEINQYITYLGEIHDNITEKSKNYYILKKTF